MFTKKSKAAVLFIVSNSSPILLKLVSGLITGSFGLIAEAVHSMIDLAATIVAFVCARSQIDRLMNNIPSVIVK